MPRIFDFVLGSPGQSRPPESMIAGLREMVFMTMLIRSWGINFVLCLGFVHAHSWLWVLENSLAEFVVVCGFEVWPAPGAREGHQKGGGSTPPQVSKRSRAPQPASPQKRTPNKSGQLAFRYPVKTLMVWCMGDPFCKTSRTTLVWCGAGGLAKRIPRTTYH